MKKTLFVMILAAGMMTFGSCNNASENRGEEATEEVEDAGEEAGDEIEEGAEEVEEEVEETGNRSNN
ncbi:hypothetical protein [Rufibacter tibetensis]|uniref:Uncharacterized protein n=1 Tax=Rufibacter tibetensis TaxID=512763 RepID=A0A0P0C2P2_9BACT|nr:hypothetical protein [Rufibacter tibetensis]ALI99258.1 hypothetical protein DC20_10065 [Rufibacter tibetensis]